MKLRFLPSVSLQEVQPTHPAEIFLHHTALLPTKPMEEIARKNREIDQLQMQLKMQIEESEHKIQDLEAENQALKRQLFQEGEQLQHEIEENMPRIMLLELLRELSSFDKPVVLMSQYS